MGEGTRVIARINDNINAITNRALDQLRRLEKDLNPNEAGHAREAGAAGAHGVAGDA